jgi:hypothetical protein
MIHALSWGVVLHLPFCVAPIANRGRCKTCLYDLA